MDYTYQKKDGALIMTTAVGRLSPDYADPKIFLHNDSWWRYG